MTKAFSKRLANLEHAAKAGDEDDRDLPVFFIDSSVAQSIREYCIILNSESSDPEVHRLQLISEFNEALISPWVTEHPRRDRIVENAKRILRKLRREGDVEWQPPVGPARKAFPAKPPGQIEYEREMEERKKRQFA